MHYAGIGSRQTPELVLNSMMTIARHLARLGHTLHSGAAAGADSAFEQGCGEGSKFIFLPWRGYNGHSSKYSLDYFKPESREKLYKLAEKYHPAWHRCSAGARKLARA